MPSCCRTLTPSSRPISSTIRPSRRRRTLVPVNRSSYRSRPAAIQLADRRRPDRCVFHHPPIGRQRSPLRQSDRRCPRNSDPGRPGGSASRNPSLPPVPATDRATNTKANIRCGQLVDDPGFQGLPQNSPNQRPTIALFSSTVVKVIPFVLQRPPPASPVLADRRSSPCRRSGERNVSIAQKRHRYHWHPPHGRVRPRSCLRQRGTCSRQEPWPRLTGLAWWQPDVFGIR